jgi:hypothetical protein
VPYESRGKARGCLLVVKVPREDSRSIVDDSKHDSDLLGRVWHTSVPITIGKDLEQDSKNKRKQACPLPQPQVPENNRPFLQMGVAGGSDYLPLLKLFIGNHGLSQLAVVVDVSVLGA